jgi:hypothetical protein
MRKTLLTFIASVLPVLVALQLRAAVQVTPADEPPPAEPPPPAAQPSSPQGTEKTVALRVAEKKYVTASPGNALDLTGAKIGSKQTFTLIDVNGGALEDGDAVRIRYTPNTAGVPDVSKSSYWRETKEGIKRGREGDLFKVKRVDTKYAFLTPGGKFVGAPAQEGVLGVTDKQADALLVELQDVARGASAAKSAGE